MVGTFCGDIGLLRVLVANREQGLHVVNWFVGDAYKDMETAKAIIGGRVKVAASDLEKIAINSEQPRSSRIAAIYALGFARAAAATVSVRKILSDEKDDVDIRAHAAEALGNLADRDAIMPLKDVLSGNPPAALRESCRYALEELKAT